MKLEILDQLQRSGIQLTPTPGTDLQVKTEQPLNDLERDLIRNNKAVIVEHLAAAQHQGAELWEVIAANAGWMVVSFPDTDTANAFAEKATRFFGEWHRTPAGKLLRLVEPCGCSVQLDFPQNRR